MANAEERLWRTPDGKLVSESAATEPGTTLAYALGDEITDEDAKAAKSGKPAPAPAGGVSLTGVQPESRADADTVKAAAKK